MNKTLVSLSQAIPELPIGLIQIFKMQKNAKSHSRFT